MGTRLKNPAKILTAAWLLLCITTTAQSNSEQISIGIGEQMRCENSTVSVPVTVADFYDVAAITILIEIDTLVTEYLAIENLNQQLTGGQLVANFQKHSSQIIISWVGMVSAFIDEGKLFDIKLNYFEGYGELIISDDSEIAFSNYIVAEDVIYENGLLIPIIIDIIKHPGSVLVDEGDIAHFEFITNHNAELSYQWQYHNGFDWENLADNDYFSGSQSDTLTIYNVSYDMNNMVLRSKAYVDQCFKLSHPALLTVNQLTGIGEAYGNELFFSVYPNPCSKYLNYEIKNGLNRYGLQLINVHGEIVFYKKIIGKNGSIIVDAFDAGIYFLKLTDGNKTKQSVKVIII